MDTQIEAADRSSERERFVRKNAVEMLLFSFGVAVWYGAEIARSQIMPLLPPGHTFADVTDFVRGLGIGIFFLTACRMFWRKRYLRAHPELRPALRDEYAQQIKLRAGTMAFLSVVAGQVLMLLALVIWPSLKRLSPALPVQVTLLLSLLTLASWLVVYQRR